MKKKIAALLVCVALVGAAATVTFAAERTKAGKVSVKALTRPGMIIGTLLPGLKNGKDTNGNQPKGIVKPTGDIPAGKPGTGD